MLRNIDFYPQFLFVLEIFINSPENYKKYIFLFLLKNHNEIK